MTHGQLKTRALKRADVKAEYNRLHDEFALLDKSLKARIENSTIPTQRRPRKNN